MPCAPPVTIATLSLQPHAALRIARRSVAATGASRSAPRRSQRGRNRSRNQPSSRGRSAAAAALTADPPAGLARRAAPAAAERCRRSAEANEGAPANPGRAATGTPWCAAFMKRAPDFDRQAAAGRLLGRRGIVVAEPDAGDEMAGVADEPGVAEILAGAGLAGGRPARELRLLRGARSAASRASSCSSSPT